jgi:hypothetical protein
LAAQLASIFQEVGMSDLLGSTSTALYTTLNGGTALTTLLGGTARIYELQAPDGAKPPYVVFNHQGGGPDNITHASIESNLWLVKVYSSTSAKVASNIFAEVDTLLNRQNISISGGSVNTWWCARETNVKLLENLPNGQLTWMRGGIFRIRTSGE